MSMVAFDPTLAGGTPALPGERITFRELLECVAAELAARGIEEARAEAEVLVMEASGISRAWLYGHPEAVVPEAGLAGAEAFVCRRGRREPTAYIVGHREFYGLDFLVDRSVLIPRPETELLVEEAIAASRRLLATRSHVAVADVGTGSGAIAVSVARSVPEATVYATDVSEGALEVARANCRKHGVEDRVRLLRGDLLGPVDATLDIMLANLPYVKDADLRTLPPEIRDFEPRAALQGGETGLGVIRRLLEQAVGRLSSGGTIALEVAWDQGREAASSARSIFPSARIDIRQDLAGLDRVVVISLGETEESY